MTYFYLFFQAALLSLPASLLLLFGPKHRDSWLQGVFILIGLKALTHPIEFFFFMSLRGTALGHVLSAEFFAIFFEALILWRTLHVTKTRAFSASLLSNLCVWQFAPVMTYFVWGAS
jgi:hypothetical protein